MLKISNNSEILSIGRPILKISNFENFQFYSFSLQNLRVKDKKFKKYNFRCLEKVNNRKILFTGIFVIFFAIRYSKKISKKSFWDRKTAKNFKKVYTCFRIGISEILYIYKLGHP